MKIYYAPADGGEAIPAEVKPAVVVPEVKPAVVEEAKPVETAPEVKPAVVEEAKPVETAPEVKAPKDKLPPWVQQRFREMTQQTAAERQRREAAEAKLAAAPVEPVADDGVKPAEATVPVAQVQALARDIASQDRAKEKFDANCDKTYRMGREKFGADFDESINVLRAAGINQETLDAIVSLPEAPHLVMQHFGDHPEEATQLFGLPYKDRLIQLARLEQRLAAPPKKTVSTAPAPVQPVGGNGGVISVEPTDKDDIKTWMDKRNATARRKFTQPQA